MTWAELYEVDGYPIVRCRACGLTTVGRRDVLEDLVALYGAPYWEDAGEVGYGDYSAAEARKRHHFRGLLEELERLTGPGQLLEVGSAYGFFLDEARKRGWRVRGVEPAEHAAHHARQVFGLAVAAGPLTELPVDGEAVDVVALWDVIEHVPNPRETLERAFEWLRPGGILALSTGDIGSLVARIHGRDWSLLTPPWHQYFFSRRTMRAMLADVGFSVVKISGDGNVAVDRSSRRPRVPSRVAAVLESRPVSTAARKLGRGGIMFVFARKPAS